MIDVLSKFAKADPDSLAWRQITAFARTLEPGYRRGFLKAMQQIHSDFVLSEVADALAKGQIDYAADLALGPGAGGSVEIWDHLLQASNLGVIAAAEHELRQLPQIEMTFARYNPAVVDIVQEEGLALVQEVSEATKQGLKTYIIESLKNGVNPNETARQMRQVIGLTERQTLAVANYRRLLEQGSSEALNRQLRDRRFDRSVIGGKLDGATIDKMVQRYYERYIQYRAANIARTESISALHQGQQALWRQAIDRGLAAEDEIYRRWFVAEDERTCEVCADIPRLNPNGVGLTEGFRTSKGLVKGPALHPSCRCYVFTRPRL